MTTSARALLTAFALVFPVFPAVSSAEVVRVEVSRREPFAEGTSFGRSGPYERITGRMHLAVDPQATVNSRIVDLRFAPRNEKGQVEFWTDFFLLKPVDPSRGNRRLFYDVNNRGNKLALGAFNNKGGNDPRTLADAGNAFLMREGYTILWCGWNGDVKAGDQRMLIGLPVATDGEQPITGRVHAEMTVNEPTYSQPFYWGNSDPYPSVSLDHRGAILTRRPNRDAAAEIVSHDQWAFARYEDTRAIPDPKHLYLKEGFKPGWIYDLVYTARDPRVTGLGFAAVRDIVSFLRHAPGRATDRANLTPGSIDRAYIFGISQSARYIQHFLFEGFNADEQGKIVFDGALAHVGGAGRGYFNHRFAQTTRHGSQHEDNLYPSEVFPFTSVREEDPVTGERGDTLARARIQEVVPKIIYTETSTEYWSRAASLLHTDVTGTRDVPLDPSVRLYFIAGGQHGVSTSSDRGIYQNPMNILDHRPPLRALLVALDQWVTNETEPPASRYPRIDDGTLVDFKDWKQMMPAIPEAGLPTRFYVPVRLDLGLHFESAGIADFVPARAGAPYHTLVPAVDEDGNERAGIRLPEIAVPLATFSGWNLRSERVGAEGALARWSGSYLPFPRTADERLRTSDPRRAIVERYPTRDVYLEKVLSTAVRLRDERFLRDEDVIEILRTATQRDFWKEKSSAATEK